MTDRSPGTPGSSSGGRSSDDASSDGTSAGGAADPCAADAGAAACPITPQFRPADGVFTISTGAAAQIAVAELQLPTPTPHIGPDPSINPWNMAAVGYPLWLWTEGPTRIGPVSQSVSDLFVSLDAHLTGTTYHMGDGRTVQCTGPGQPWTPTVTPGAPSGCGHTYQRPSLPAGDYTVRSVAHWAVTWTVGDTTGTLTVDREATAALPVGELQALVR